MISHEQSIPGVHLIHPDLHQDARGIFHRSFCQAELRKRGIYFEVKQGNISENFALHTLRGFHYQVDPSQEAKILTCVTGSLYNLVVDLRKKSATYKQWIALNLSAKSGESLHVPAGCGNAFLTMSDHTIVHYYMSDVFSPDSYRGIRFDDPSFGFVWPHSPAVISVKDASFPDFQEE